MNKKILSYEAFKETVPEETMKFVDAVLPFFENHIVDEAKIYISNYGYNSESANKAAAIFLNALFTQDDQYRVLLSEMGYNKNSLQVSKTKTNKPENTFSKCVNYFCVCDDLSKYQTLTPLQLLEDAYAKSDNVSGILAYSFSDPRSFKYKLSSEITGEKNLMSKELSFDLYQDMEITVVRFLEKVASIHQYLMGRLSTEKYNMEEICALSMFFAIYFYKDVAVKQDGIEFSEKEALTQLLKKYGISSTTLNSYLSIELDANDVSSLPADPRIIKQYYKRYFEGGVCENLSKEAIRVTSLVTNLMDRDLVGSHIVEKILALKNCTVSDFSCLDEKVEADKKEQAARKNAEYVDDFYKGLPLETIDFMEFVTKLYTVISQKMKETTTNAEYLSYADDADTLALFLAGHYFHSDVNRFFQDYGVDYQKTLKLLNLDITREQVEQTPLDMKILVDRFQRFVRQGVNRTKYPKDIKVNDVVRNLCDRSFNKSMILEKVFDELTDDLTLQSDFLPQLEEHLKIKEQERVRKISEKLFSDLPVSSIEYLENVSKYHQFIRDNNSTMNEGDIRVYAMILALSNTKELVGSFFDSIELNSKAVEKTINFSNYKQSNTSVNLDLLKEQYGEIIFGGHNKGKQRHELTIKSLATNIFNKDVHQSVDLAKFLNKQNLSYEYFGDFEDHYQYFLRDQKEKALAEKCKTIFGKCRSGARQFFDTVTKIHQRIELLAKDPLYETSQIHGVLNTEIISMFLAAHLYPGDASKFLGQSDLTTNAILRLSGLPQDFLADIEKEQASNQIFLNNYQKYIPTEKWNGRFGINDFIVECFNKKTNSSSIIERFTSSVEKDPEILRGEIKTGQKYVKPLSVEDRISELKRLPIDVLKEKDSVSVAEFGNSLTEHSNYISEASITLASNDKQGAAISAVKEHISDMYQKPAPRKRTFLEKLFQQKEEEEAVFVYDPQNMDQLNEVLNSYVKSLAQEIKEYAQIRDYLDAYAIKNREFIASLDQKITKLETILRHSNPQSLEEENEFSNNSAHLKTLGQKKKRFETTDVFIRSSRAQIQLALTNHFLTIDSLEMTRDVLIPSLLTELTLAKGNQNASEALAISGSIMDLAQKVVEQNVEGTKEVVAKLGQFSTSFHNYASVDAHIQEYLKTIQQAQNQGTKPEDSSVAEAKPAPLTFQSEIPTINNADFAEMFNLGTFGFSSKPSYGGSSENIYIKK